jgi:hypothetical protein
VALLATGCEIKQEQPETKPPPVIRVPPVQAALVAKDAALAQQADRQAQTQPRQPTQPKPQAPPKSVSLADAHPNRDRNDLFFAADDSPNANRATESAKSQFNVHQALIRIAAEIRDALGLGKTLVVLLVEQTPDAGQLPDRMSEQMTRLSNMLCVTNPGRFEMAVISYGSTVKLLTAGATGNVDQLDQALSSLKRSDSDAEKTAESNAGADVFAAFQQAVEKFLPYRARGYEVIFVVAGASSGDDLNLADQTIIALHRAAVPVYGLGPAMPFGAPRNTNRASRQEAAAAATPAGADHRRFESLWPERLQLVLSGNQTTVDLNDSGYGPFGLERICRLTGGKFFRLRNDYPPGWTIDPSTGDIPWLLSDKYAPNYLDEKQYDQLLSQNKCRQALHEAALLPPTEGLESVRTDFPKEKDEAALAKIVTTAQKAAAIHDQPIQQLYDTLIVGEPDRPKLTGARWQAGYDLALGQVLAAKARLDGYNAMLALLKQGKSFAHADSTRWVLEPADEIAAGSVLDKMAKKSRAYLQRVVNQHPGTPWAAVAQRELHYPAGWKFVEK